MSSNSHGKRAIGVRAIEVRLYNPLIHSLFFSCNSKNIQFFQNISHLCDAIYIYGSSIHSAHAWDHVLFNSFTAASDNNRLLQTA